MKNHQDPITTKTSSSPFSTPRFGRFRLPFRSKSEHISNSSSSSSNIITPSITSPVKSNSAILGNRGSPPSGSHGFFNLKKFGGNKSPGTSSIRKGVTFTPGSTSMDWKKKVSSDHTDIAYREAVSRLRNILSPRPTGSGDKALSSASPVLPIQQPKPISNVYTLSPKKTTNYISDQLSKVNAFNNDTSAYMNLNNYYSRPQFQRPTTLSAAGEDDLFGFIEKQGEYINQLEKETKYCRDELGVMLDKVKDVISENEALHEKQKHDMLTSMIQHLDEKTDGYGYGHGDAPSNKSILKGKSEQVIRDSKIAELEAQLGQAKRSLRLAQEEVLEIRRGKADPTGVLNSTNIQPNGASAFMSCELHRSEIESLTREKDDLLETLNKLKQMVSDLRDRESEATRKVKTSLEVVDQMREEKAQSDMETRRLKEELDRHQQRVREMIQEHSKKIHEEKLQVEKKYRQEIDHLNNEMNQEMDSLTKVKLELERQKRTEADLRRELQHKMSTIDDLRQEMQIKMNHLQAELSHTLMQKSSAEQDLINTRLMSEKIERDGKQEASRLQTELNLVRKRLEETDNDLAKSQEVIVRLNENISQLQREASLAKIRLQGHLSAEKDDEEVNNMIQSMEHKHSKDMTDLEQLIQVQNNLLDKLRNECKVLVEKLEETSRQYKKEKALLEGEKERLIQMNKSSQEKCVDLEHKVKFYSSSHEQMTGRLHKLEDDDKARSDRIFQLLSKQSGLLKENQSLQNEVSYLKSKVGDFSNILDNNTRNVS